MHTSVSCVIRLYDDLTGKLLKGPQYQFKVNGVSCRPICKPDGCFVLTNRTENILKIEVFAEYYRKTSLAVDTTALDKTKPLCDIRLLPTAKASGSSLKRLKGNIKVPDTWVIAVPELEKPLFKYGGIEEKKNVWWMTINSLNYQTLQGHLFIIKDNQYQDLELFTVKDKEGHNLFEISGKLQKEYKINQEVVRVYRTLSEEDGSFEIPVDDFYDTSSYTLVYSKGKKWVHETLTL